MRFWAPRMPVLPFVMVLLFMVAPAAPVAGVDAVWALATPAAATRARVSNVVFIGGPPPVLVGSPATRGAECTFRGQHFLLCPLFATGVALPQQSGKRVAYDYIIVGGGSAGS